jgi:6-pyruvoyltetrahydropterin/6-carboxytetrahydropterin synthase
MHGHTYRVRLEVTGEIDATMGWVVDYAELKRLWEPIKDALDHRCLNDFMPNPTCEIIARWIGNKIELVSRVELRETVNCGVVWQR